MVLSLSAIRSKTSKKHKKPIFSKKKKLRIGGFENYMFFDDCPGFQPKTTQPKHSRWSVTNN